MYGFTDDLFLLLLTLSDVGFFQLDIDECTLAAVTGLQACQGVAECRNSPGSFTCSCPAGYVMALNKRGCVGEAGVTV